MHIVKDPPSIRISDLKQFCHQLVDPSGETYWVPRDDIELLYETEYYGDYFVSHFTTNTLCIGASRDDNIVDITEDTSVPVKVYRRVEVAE